MHFITENVACRDSFKIHKKLHAPTSAIGLKWAMRCAIGWKGEGRATHRQPRARRLASAAAADRCVPTRPGSPTAGTAGVATVGPRVVRLFMASWSA
eukprot:4051362-Prymnesium_polylepis.1